jgi:hypothetical protein
MEEDALPLSTPYIDKEGKAHHSLPLVFYWNILHCLFSV